MIASVKLCVNHSIKVRKLGIGNPYVHFKPGYNVLIERNGSGKSTLLRAIALCPMCTVARAEDDVIKYITTETLNPNVGGDGCFPGGNDSGDSCHVHFPWPGRREQSEKPNVYQ